MQLAMLQTHNLATLSLSPISGWPKNYNCYATKHKANAYKNDMSVTHDIQ